MKPFTDHQAGRPPEPSPEEKQRVEVYNRFVERADLIRETFEALESLKATQLRDLNWLLKHEGRQPWMPADSLDQETADLPKLTMAACPTCGHMKRSDSRICDTPGCDSVRTLDLTTSQVLETLQLMPR